MESNFLAKLVRRGDLGLIKEHGITAAHFIEPDAIKIFEYIIQQAEYNSGKSVAEATLRQVFPQFLLPDAPEELSFYIRQLSVAKDNRALIGAITTLRDIQQNNPENPELVKSEALSLIRGLELSSGTDYGISIVETAKEVNEEYDRLKEGSGLLGYPFPWPTLSDATLGIQNSDFNLIAGRPKRYKTWLLLVIADYLHSGQGLRTIVFTKELTESQMRTRIVVLRYRMDWRRYRKGDLTVEEEARLNAGIDEWGVQEDYRVIRISGTGDWAISEMEGHIERLKPDFIGVDGLQLFANSSEWNEMTKLSRSLKQMFSDYELASVCTTQRKQPPPGKKTVAAENSVAYADAFLQDCDNLITIERSDADAAVNQVVLELSASRNGSFVKFSVNTRVAFDFKEKRDLTNNADVFDDIYEKTLDKADSLVSA